MMNSIDKKLKTILFRHLCPTQMELGEYELGLLDAARTREIDLHIKGCKDCQQDLVEIREFLTMTESPTNASMDQPPLAEKIKLFVIDLLSPPAGTVLTPSLQPAMRGDKDDMQTRVYAIGPYIVAISIAKDITQLETYDLLGDISLPEDEKATFNSWQAHLWQKNRLVLSQSLEQDGHFRFVGVQFTHHPYELILSGPEGELHLQNLYQP